MFSDIQRSRPTCIDQLELHSAPANWRHPLILSKSLQFCVGNPAQKIEKILRQKMQKQSPKLD